MTLHVWVYESFLDINFHHCFQGWQRDASDVGLWSEQCGWVGAQAIFVHKKQFGNFCSVQCHCGTLHHPQHQAPNTARKESKREIKKYQVCELDDMISRIINIHEHGWIIFLRMYIGLHHLLDSVGPDRQHQCFFCGSMCRYGIPAPFPWKIININFRVLTILVFFSTHATSCQHHAAPHTYSIMQHTVTGSHPSDLWYSVSTHPESLHLYPNFV